MGFHNAIFMRNTVEYILFGDEPRTDGGNIAGIYFSESLAEEQKQKLEERYPNTFYNIEEHFVWG